MVKTTGFPYEQLEGLTDPRVRAVIEADDRDDTAIERALVDNQRRLLDAFDDRVQEAVFLSSPGAYQSTHKIAVGDLPPEQFTSQDKRRILTAAVYLQRLCSKNESTSFFGAVHWARVGAEAERTVIEPGLAEPRRGVFFAHWAIQAIADQVAADPAVRPELVARVPPNVFLRSDGARLVRFVEAPITVHDLALPLTELGRRLLVEVDGRRSARQLATALGMPVEQVVQELSDLHRAELVRFDLELPMGTAEPADDLLEFVAGLAEPVRLQWHGRIVELCDRRDDFATAHGLADRITAMERLGAQFAGVSGTAPLRNAGELAADRGIVIEDCVGDWPRFDLGGRLAKYLDTELPSVLDLLYELPLARRRVRLAHLQQWFDGRFGADRPVPLDEALLAAADDENALGRQLTALDEEVRRTGPSAITDQLWQHADRSRVELGMDWAAQARAAIDFDTWCVSGVDLFVAAPSVEAINEGKFTALVGEVHALHDQLLQGLWPRLHPEPATLAKDIGELIAAVTDRTVCDPTLPHRRKTMAREDVLPEVEFCELSPRPAERKTQANRLSIISTGGRLELLDDRLGSLALTRPPLWWWNREVDSLFTPFTGARIANMVDTTRANQEFQHLPRLTVGQTVLARETWWLPPIGRHRKDQNLVPANQRAMWRIKGEFGLPDQVYVRFAEESKPVFVDFDMPVLVDLLAQLWRRTEHPVEVSEMVPGPAELWLRDSTGRHPCELRIGYYRPAAG
ncbi:MAG: lantibiotic dehydratase [Jatrophihabitantaceae bacterium]